MNFLEAVKAMDMGNKVSREVWRGQISYWEMCRHCTCIHETYPNGKSTCFKKIMLEEVLAEDWFIVV